MDKKTVETILISFSHLMEAASEDKDNYDIETAIGEFEINNKIYQMQISLKLDKSLWMNNTDIRFTSCEKIIQ